MTQHKTPAFSLLELLITIVVIGILAAVAIPAYEQHVVRARAASMLSSVETIKKELGQYRAVQGPFSNLSGTSFEEFGARDPSLDVAEISAAHVVRYGGNPNLVTVALCGSSSDLGLESSNNFHIFFDGTFSNGKVDWTCTCFPAAATRFLPKNCRTVRASGAPCV